MIVPGGHRAVIFDRFEGVKKDVIGEGTHFLVPWLQKAIIYDVRTKPRNISTTTGSKGIVVGGARWSCLLTSSDHSSCDTSF